MTDLTVSPPSRQPVEYIRLWAENFAHVLTQITGGAMPCVARPEAPTDLESAAETDLWATVTCSGGLRGEMCLRVASPTVLHLAQIFMSERLSPEAGLTADHRDAFIELLRQVAGLVSTSAKARWGETQLRVELATAAPSWSAAESFWLQAGEEGAVALVLEVSLSAALLAELRAEKSETARTDAAKLEANATPLPAAISVLPIGAMDVLMDVQLGVAMRFGSRRLLLREVLDLSPGAVVELDRRVQDPVELLLDGKLIARGEVVVIDGNYGLRVTDASPLAGSTENVVGNP